MSTDIGPKIGIQGEAEYKRSMKELAAATKTLGTEAKLITSEFVGEEKSTEALKAKNDVLQRSVYQLNDVLEKQEEHLKKVANAYGEADARTMKAQQDVNKTKTAINNFNAEIRKNNEQISTNGTALGKLGSALSGYVEKLGLGDTALGKMASSMSSGTLATTAFSAAVVKLASDLVRLSDAAGRHADEVNTLAQTYGMSTQSIQQFQYMSELVDVSMETFTGSLSKLTRNMDSARDGTGAAADAFRTLGVSVTNSDGSLRSANQVFGEVIDALGSVGNETERDALAMEIFGKSAMELNPLIAQGSEGLRELADEAANSGYVMSDKMISVLLQGDDATQRLNKSMDGLQNTIGAVVTPVVGGWKLAIAEAADDMATFIQRLTGMREGADEVATAIDGASASLASFRDLTKEDIAQMQREAVSRQVSQAAEVVRQNGWDINVYAPGGMVDYRNMMAQQQQPVNVTLEIDKQTLAQVMYDPNRSESSRRGSSAYY